jgi:Permuted papain-like amidase enzyme, YaeF/YiiX, C92 family
MNRILSYIYIILLISCGNASLPDTPRTPAEKNAAMLREASKQIKTGDILLRCGKDMTSYKIREMSETDKTYSHAGIAVVKPEGVFIYHLTPPELDEPKGDTLIRLEALSKFANPENNFEFGIGRFPLTEKQIEQLISYTDSLRERGISFDWLFDLKSPNKMYCSEMIDDCIRYATNDSISLKKNEFRDPRLVRKVGGYLRADTNIVRSRLYIPIENIYLHPACSIVGQFKFVPVVE